jgi:hypothetical protein
MNSHVHGREVPGGFGKPPGLQPLKVAQVPGGPGGPGGFSPFTHAGPHTHARMHIHTR